MERKIANWIGFWLKKNYRAICNYLDNELEKYDLTNSQLGVLLLLWETDGVSQKEVQQALGIKPASLTNLIKGLEGKGLIKRIMDPVDSRVNRIYLTEKGKSLEEPCMPIVDLGEQMVKKGFSPEEAVLLRSWLQRVYKNFDETK